MTREQLPLAIERHATSKLPDDDLLAIHFMGFRGEALPSIGSIARLAITSHARGTAEAFTLRVEADQLCIEGDLSMPMPPNLETGYAEVQRSRFRRTFTLSKELDAEKIGAELSNGVLRLRIPKVAYAQPRRIPIQAG
jgi:hypothetical protein